MEPRLNKKIDKNALQRSETNHGGNFEKKLAVMNGYKHKNRHHSYDSAV